MAFQAILPNLAENDQGDDVGFLHAALDKLDLGGSIPIQERTANRFGQGTAAAVSNLQSQFGLAPATLGKVDQQTADFINQQLFQLGVFRSVEGRVVSHTGSAVAGNLLFAFDTDNIGGAYLGSTYAKTDGAYQIYYDPFLYTQAGRGVLKIKDPIDLVVQVYDAQGKTLAESQPVHDPRPQEQISLILPDPELADSAFVIRGQVVDASGPLNNILVTVFDRDLFSGRPGAPPAQQLGTGFTQRRRDQSEEGWFEFTYQPESFAAADRLEANNIPRPDLIFSFSQNGQLLEPIDIIRLSDGKEVLEDTVVNGNDLLLGIQARRIEEVRIRLKGGAPPRELSEYERLLQAIEPLLPQRAPANASEAEREDLVHEAVQRFDEANHRDLSFVARETGFAFAVIQAMVTAVNLSLDPFRKDLPVFVFYALARTRSVADLPSLGRLSTTDLQTGLKEAESQVPPLIPPLEPRLDLDQTVDQIRSVLAATLPTYRSPDGTPSLSDLVGHALPDSQDQATLWQRITDHSGSAEEFWADLQQQPGFTDPATIANLQFAFDLSALAENNLSMMAAIRSEHPQLTSMRDLAFELGTKERWSTLLKDPKLAIQIPEDIPGKPEERADIYAEQLARTVQIAHPSVAIATMLANEPALLPNQTQVPVSEFLIQAIQTTDFDLVDGHIDDLVATHGEDLLANVDQDQQMVIIDQVKRLQRVFRLSTGPESMKVLLEAGFESARDLAELPSEIAMDVLTPAIGEDAAALVLNRARNISAMAIHQYVVLTEASNGVLPEVFHGIQ